MGKVFLVFYLLSFVLAGCVRLDVGGNMVLETRATA
jgi:hypothetical protein